MKLKSALVMVLIIQPLYGYHDAFRSCKLISVLPKTERDLQFLWNLRDHHSFRFINTTCTVNVPTIILFDPRNNNDLPATLDIHKLTYHYITHRITSILPRAIRPRLKGTVTFERCMRYSEIMAYLNTLKTNNPDKVSVHLLTKTFKDNAIHVIEISTNRTAEKPIILIEAGIHGLEWMGTAQALYIINELVENPQNAYLLEDVDWHIVPVLNPDGYEYSHISNPFWARSRGSTLYGTINCVGVDLNNNFDFNWKPIHNEFTCSKSIAGQHAFSEPESFHFANHAIKHKHRICTYLSFHSSAGTIHYPWSYTKKRYERHDIHVKIADEMNKAIKNVNGRTYKIQKFCYALGTSADWAAGILKIPFVFTISLHSVGLYGFSPNASEILPLVKDTFEGIKLFSKCMKIDFF